MRILVYGINYSPELTGIGKYTGEMCAWLSQNGHTVSVITAMPYYPMWEVEKKYKRRWWHTEKIDGVKIHRCPLYVPKKISAGKRIIHEFSFIASIFPYWFKTLFQKKYDIVICICPPFHLGFYPFVYSKLRGAKSVTHIQDLQVDAAQNLGMIKNKFLLRVMFAAERFLLRKSNAVSTISPGMQKKIEAKKIDTSRIIMFPNWVDEDIIKPLSKEQSLRTAFNIQQSDKVVLYSGNLGEKQGLESIIEVAKAFTGRPDVHFIIVGSGAAKEKLQKMAADNNLTSVKFFPLQPYKDLSALLAIADVHLVLEKKSASDLVMPSKLISIMASGGCPIVATSKGSTLYNVVDQYQVGILIEPENTTALTRGIEKALNADLSVYRNNGRKYAEQFLTKNAIMANWEKNLQQLLSI